MIDNNEKIFRITLLVSLVLHALILFPIPKNKKQENSDPAFLNYLALNISQPKTKDVPVNRKTNIENPINDIAEKKTYRTIRSTKKNRKSANRELNDAKDELIVPETLPEKEVEIKEKQLVKKEPVLPKVDNQDLSKDKFYISYYRLINEILRDAVIYPEDFSEGEIALTFILNADGSLVNVDVLQDTSYKNNSLRETAKQIVKNAAPFPPFPKELRHDQLTFNVVFCFRERS